MTTGQKTVQGVCGAKLRVEVQPFSGKPWQIQIWVNDGQVIDYVFEQDVDDEIDHPHRLPIGQARKYFDEYYHSDLEAPSKRMEATSVIGNLAGALICILAEEGKLSLPKACCSEGASRCATARVMDVMSKEAMANYRQAVIKYGWDAETIARDGEFEALKASLTIMKSSPPTFAKTRVRVACSLFVEHSVGDHIKANSITGLACYIAMDAITTSTASLEPGCRYFSPRTAIDFSRSYAAIGAFFCRDGIDVRQFRRIAFLQLIPGLEEFSDRDLIVANNGYVAGMAILWRYSTLQREVLRIKCVRGSIQRDGISYDRVREVDFFDWDYMNSSLLGGRQESIVLCPGGQYQGIPLQAENVSFGSTTSIKGSQLLVKHYLQRPRTSLLEIDDIRSGKQSDQNLEKRRVSWIDGMNVLATAAHVG